MSEEGHHIVVGLLDNVGRQCDMMFGYTDEHDVQQPDGTTARQLALLYTGENEAKLEDECRAGASDTAVKAKKDGTAPPPQRKYTTALVVPYAQITEICCVERIHQPPSQESRARFDDGYSY